jgi:hypothetical protein
MRLYYTGASPANVRKAREHAPSHSHGWTPQKMTPHDAPYFLYNGAYTDSYDAEAYYGTIHRIEMGDTPQSGASNFVSDG